jgi:hypothetical protein
VFHEVFVLHVQFFDQLQQRIDSKLPMPKIPCLCLNQ